MYFQVSNAPQVELVNDRGEKTVSCAGGVMMAIISKLKLDTTWQEVLDPIDAETYEAYSDNRRKIDELIALNNRLVDLALEKANADLKNRPTGKLIFLVNSAYNDRKVNAIWDELSGRPADLIMKAPERLTMPFPLNLSKQCRDILHTLKQNKSIILWSANTYIFRGLEDAYCDGVLSDADVEIYTIENKKLVRKQPSEADGFNIESYVLSF